MTKLMEIKWKPSLIELFFAQLVVWVLLWLLSEYVAMLLTITIAAVVFAVLLVALIAEWIERSRVPASYFHIMGLSLLAMILAASTYVYLIGGRFDFLHK
jgi:hypothetical protein